MESVAKNSAQSPAVKWVIIVVALLALMVAMRRRHEGLTPKKDVKITTGLPSDVKYVVKKGNGETVVVKKDGRKVRYAKGDMPSFLKTKPKSTTKQSKDVKVTKGLPKNVAYVIKKANGETVVVKSGGGKERYPKGQLPAFMKKTSGSSTNAKSTTGPKKDRTVTKGLPADVKYVVKKANGKTVVVKKNGQINRYPKGKAPSYVKPSKSDGGGGGGGGGQSQTAEALSKAIAKVQKQLDGINATLKAGRDGDDKVIRQVRDLLDKRLSKLKEAEQHCYSGMYVDNGAVWVLQ